MVSIVEMVNFEESIVSTSAPLQIGGHLEEEKSTSMFA
jgi:hypothetical protein